MLLTKLAFGRALKKPCPPRFSYAPENAGNIDYYHVSLKSDLGCGFHILVENVSSKGITGLQWDGQKFSISCSLPNQHVQESEIEIIRFFRTATTRYSSISDFWKGELTFVTRRFLISENFRQLIFNSSTRFRHDRMDLLRRLLEIELNTLEGIQYLDDKGRHLSSHSWFGAIYGQRAFGHPRFEAEFKKFNWLMSSLEASGDLRKNGSKYQVSAQAMQTLAHFEQEERRHKDSVRQNVLLFAITVVIAAATCVQAYYSWASAGT